MFKKFKFLGVLARILFVIALSSCSQAAVINTVIPSPSSLPEASTPTAISNESTPVSPVTTQQPNTAITATAGAQIPVTSGNSTLQPPQYIQPLQNAEYVSKDTAIAVRYGPSLTSQNVAGIKFVVKGEKSGLHDGQTILADDQKTVIFKPNQPFTPGEQVNVSANSLQVDAQTGFLPLSYSFTIAVNQQPGGVGATTQAADFPPKSAFPNDLTVPQDIPHFTITKPSTDNGEGDIFVAPIYWLKAITGAYLLILDGQGHLIYYKSMADDYNAFDFKKLPNGMLTYFSQKDFTYYVMNSHYQVVNSYQAGNGYTADLHDLQVLPNGNVLLMAYDKETVDMSKVVPGGKPDASVMGLVVQELDPSKNVIFQWRSWDYVPFTDSNQVLTDQNIDLIHGNSLALTNDGNLLLSCRNLSEILKIDLQTGAVIWRLGGKANQFLFLNDQPFAYQHDVRQLPNGDITVFDNHGTEQNPAPSRGVEYRLDVANMTVTKVWEYSPQPPVFATYMGDTQRLPDGNTFLDWGAPFKGTGYQFINMIEVDPNNNVLFQFAFDQPYVSYRAFRAPWQGFPDTLPSLAYKDDNGVLTLGYSWNGATEVTSWQLYGGSNPNTLGQVDKKAKDGFETQSHFTNLPNSVCYFQAAAIGKDGKEMARSKIISIDPINCPMK